MDPRRGVPKPFEGGGAAEGGRTIGGNRQTAEAEGYAAKSTKCGVPTLEREGKKKVEKEEKRSVAHTSNKGENGSRGGGYRGQG